MMRLALVILLFIVPLGCGSQEPPSVNEPGAVVSSTDGRVTLSVRTNAKELRTIDQLIVSIEISRASDAQAELVTPDWQADGWTLIQSHNEPERLVDGRFVSRRSVTIEPFLAGEYRIGSIFVQTASGVIQTVPIAISVKSVLGADDANSLEPAAVLTGPEVERTSKTGMILGIGAIMGLVFAACIFWWVGRTDFVPAPTPIEQLQRVAAGKITDEHAALARVHHAVEAFAHNTILAEIRTRCVQIRFRRDPVDGEPSAQALASEALAVLEGTR